MSSEFTLSLIVEFCVLWLEVMQTSMLQEMAGTFSESQYVYFDCQKYEGHNAGCLQGNTTQFYKYTFYTPGC